MSDWVDDPQDDEWTDDAAPENRFSAGQSALMHGLQGATGGFMDEIQGAGEAAGRVLGVQGVGGPMRDLGLASEGPTLDWETLRDAYKAARDRERSSLKTQSEEHPYASGAGNVAGAVVSPLNKLIGGLSLAKGGAALGAVNGLGTSDAEDLGGMATDTAIGLGTGMALGKGVDKASPLLARGAEKLSSGASDLAERFAGRALGAERGTIKSIGADRVKAAGRQALDEGVLSPLASTEDMIARNAALKAKGGGMMGEAYNAIDEAGASTFSPLNAAKEVDESLGGFYRSPINKGETSQLDNTLESIMMRTSDDASPIAIREAQELKEELGKVANWKNNLNITDKEQMARDAYKIVSRQIDEAVESGASAIDKAGLADTLSKGKDIYSKASTSDRLLQNKQAREEGNKILGITDWGLLGGGLGAAVPTGGASIPATLAMTGGKKVLEKYGSQNAALGLDKVSKMLMKSPKMAELYSRNPSVFQKIAEKMESQVGGGMSRAAENESKPYDQEAIIQKTQGTKYAQSLQGALKRGPQAFGAAHFILQSRDPEYRRAIMDDENE